jgi:hypothetical protein
VHLFFKMRRFQGSGDWTPMPLRVNAIFSGGQNLSLIYALGMLAGFVRTVR